MTYALANAISCMNQLLEDDIAPRRAVAMLAAVSGWRERDSQCVNVDTYVSEYALGLTVVTFWDNNVLISVSRGTPTSGSVDIRAAATDPSVHSPEMLRHAAMMLGDNE